MEQIVNSGDIADMRLKIASQERYIASLEDIIYQLIHALPLSKKQRKIIKEKIEFLI